MHGASSPRDLAKKAPGYLDSIEYNRQKSNIGGGFPVVTRGNIMKNTILKIVIDSLRQLAIWQTR
jgi:hypothetical protein